MIAGASALPTPQASQIMMKDLLRSGVALTLFVLQPCLLASGVSIAQSYPTKAVRLIVPFAPGGGLDIMARVIAQPLAGMWGQSVVVDNRPGAGGMLGMQTASNAPADGYTLIMLNTNLAPTAILQDRLAVLRSFTAGRFMGRWTRAVGAVFLDWIAAIEGARWLDVGCGTGVFTQLILDTCRPAAVIAVDPAPAQIDHARLQPVAQRAEFLLADAQSLPFPDGAFDIVASALVLNFIPDRALALEQMRRVARSDGVVAGYVWDYTVERSPTSFLRMGLRQIRMEPPVSPGTEASTLAALQMLFEQAGMKEIATRTIDVQMRFPSFDNLWQVSATGFSPISRIVASLSDANRSRLIDRLHTILPAHPNGSVSYSARANAIKARAWQ
jgi:SAM-dependent methyltransferase